ncbi:MAG TPA: hypothetical protein VFQ25_07870, partial [Ktedonobacterales bacterium]|nr:hypothetical protein [Ktedonobacterales bacterium]
QLGLTIASILLTHFAPSLAPVLTIPSAIGQPLSSGDVHNIILNGVFLIVALIFTIWLLVSAGPILILGRPFGVRATENGIESVNEIGWRSRIAWHEARLFEIDSKGDGQIRRTYRLYGQGKSVTWQEYASGLGAGRAPYHATTSENALRQAALLNLITARTGLKPRTIVRKLERPPIAAATAAPPSYPPYPPYPPAPYPPAPESYAIASESYPSVAGRAQLAPAARLELPAEARQRVRNRRSNAVVWGMCALFLAALAGAEGVVPVTDYDWVNWVSMAALALLALNCIRMAVVSVRGYKPAVAVAGPPPVAAPTLDEASSAYALSYRAPARNRSRTFVLGLLLAANLIPGAIAFFQAFGALFSINPLFNQQPLTDPANAVISVFGGLWDFILGLVLVPLGIGGIVWLVVALRLTRAPAVTVRVDANGLTRLTAFKPVLIPWSTMREVVWTPHGVGSAPAYIVRTDDPLQTITWPTSPHYLDSTLTPADARPIGPDELAALVAVRIGQDIRVSA